MHTKQAKTTSKGRTMLTSPWRYLGALLLGFVALPIALVFLSGCPTGGLVQAKPGPVLSGCPDGDTADVIVGESVALEVTISEGMLLGVVANSVSLDVDVTIARVDNQKFSVVVTPSAPGPATISLSADSDTRLIPATLECTFTVISHLGACCEGIICEETDENECFFRDGQFKGHGTTCDTNPCSGACCKLPPDNACVELPEANCATEGGEYMGDGSTCTLTCLCDTVADCPDDDDPCTTKVCEGGLCGQASACAGDLPCDAQGVCPIQISVDFPTTLNNGESADLVIDWGGGTNFVKTASFYPKFGTCPDGYACATKTLTLENALPFTLPNAFTCRIDGATAPVVFTYQTYLLDGDGNGSNIVTLEITCVP